MTKRTVIKRSSDSQRGADMKSILDKQYSEKAFEYIKGLHSDRGMTYEAIAEQMNREGWCGPRGNKLDQPTLSRFMNNRGYKVFERRPKSEGRIITPYVNAPDFEKDIIKILQTDFPEATKARLIMALTSAPPPTSNDNGNKK